MSILRGLIIYYHFLLHLRICTLAIPPTPAAWHPEPRSLPRSPPGISPPRFQSLDAPLATSRGGSNRRRAFPLTSTRNTSLRDNSISGASTISQFGRRT